MIAALDSVPIQSMRQYVYYHIFTSTDLTLDISRFATQAFHFMDAYKKGLNGQQAVWLENDIGGTESFSVKIIS